MLTGADGQKERGTESRLLGRGHTARSRQIRKEEVTAWAVRSCLGAASGPACNDLGALTHKSDLFHNAPTFEHFSNGGDAT